MEKFYSFIKTLKRKRIPFLLLVLFCIVLYGCFELKTIEQPTSAKTYSHFEVGVVCISTTDDNNGGRGLFGVLMPIGWDGQEYSDYTVFNKDGSIRKSGRFSYDQEYSNHLKDNYTTPEGYYWWGGRTIEDVPIYGKGTEISFKFRIYTDGQTGNFNLRYVVGTNANGIQDFVNDETYHPISITKGTIEPVDKIEQSGSAETYSTSDLDVLYTFTESLNSREHAYFGALLPKGWRAQDYTNYNITYKDGTDKASGRFCYDQYYADYLEKTSAAPTGYYWWGGRTIDKVHLNPTINLSFKYRIFTDDKAGNYDIKYIMGINPDSNADDFINEVKTVAVTLGNKYPIEKIADWELLSYNSEDYDGRWDENIKFYSDNDYNNFFKRWYGWTGGDIARSTSLEDGRSVWVYGDSHSGEVLSGRKRQGGDYAQFERNYVFVQDGEDFSAFKLINEGTPKDKSIKELFVPTDDEGNPYAHDKVWYWPSGGTVYYRNGVPELQLILSRIKDYPNPEKPDDSWGFVGDAADVAVLSLPDLKLKKIYKDKHKIVNVTRIETNDEGKEEKVIYGLEYAGYVLKDDDGTVYIYGTGNVIGICGRSGFVARVVNGDLTGNWEFYDNKTKEWSTDISWQGDWKEGDDPDAVINRWAEAAVSDNPVFAFKDGDKYFGITQPGRCFSSEIKLYEAESPYGPFKNDKVIGVLPKEINGGDYFCSLLAIHPQYSKNGEIMFSVSKNTHKDLSTWYEDKEGSADTYLPYFFRAKNWRDKLNIASEDYTDKDGILTAQYEDNLEYLTDNDEKTIYSASSGSAWIQYELPYEIRLRRYTITSAPDSPEKDPLHWKLLGSNDGKDWKVIDERYYAEFEERSQTVNYTPLIEDKFMYFRLEILNSKEGQGLQMAEWQIFGKLERPIGTVAGLEEVIVNGKSIPIEDVMNAVVLPTEPKETVIELKAADYGIIEGGKTLIKLDTEPGISKYKIKVTSEDEASEKEYELVLNRWFAFDDVVKVKWNNTLMLYLNRLEDYNITGYQWYQNNSKISGATGKTYSAGTKKTDLLDTNSPYHIEFETPEGILRSDAKSVTMKSSEVKVYPNPIKSGESVTIVADLEDDLLIGATIGVYNMQGNKVSSKKAQGNSTTMSLPSSAGTYFIQFKAVNGFERTLKVVVK